MRILNIQLLSFFHNINRSNQLKVQYIIIFLDSFQQPLSLYTCIIKYKFLDFNFLQVSICLIKYFVICNQPYMRQCIRNRWPSSLLGYMRYTFVLSDTVVSQRCYLKFHTPPTVYGLFTISTQFLLIPHAKSMRFT